jgi:hypothetical protein
VLTVQKLKTIRHPSVLKFEWEQRDELLLSMVTEPVTPLIALSDELTAPEICLGLFDAAQALDFLHARVSFFFFASGFVSLHEAPLLVPAHLARPQPLQCKIAHNKLTHQSLFVSDTDHTWKLAGLEWAAPLDKKATAHVADVLAYVKLVEELSGLIPSCKGVISVLGMLADIRMCVPLLVFARGDPTIDTRARRRGPAGIPQALQRDCPPRRVCEYWRDCCFLVLMLMFPVTSTSASARGCVLGGGGGGVGGCVCV